MVLDEEILNEIKEVEQELVDLKKDHADDIAEYNKEKAELEAELVELKKE